MDVEPLETLRMGDHPGAPLTKAPRRTRDTYCYWFDAAGDIRARLHGSDLQGQFYEEFFTWLPDGIVESVLYGSSPMKDLINVKVRRFAGPRLLRSDTQGKYGVRLERFEYDPIGRLTRVLVHEEERVGHARSHEVVVEYDGQSETPRTIDRIFPNGRVATIFGAV